MGSVKLIKFYTSLLYVGASFASYYVVRGAKNE